MLHHKPEEKDEMLNIYLDVTLEKVRLWATSPKSLAARNTHMYRNRALAMIGKRHNIRAGQCCFSVGSIRFELLKPKNSFGQLANVFKNTYQKAK